MEGQYHQPVNNFKVLVKCFTFNHSKFIQETLNGFVTQQTNFPFLCAVVDDCSIDGEQDVILNYLQKQFDLEDKFVVRNEDNNNDYTFCYARHKTNHNCFFAVFLLKYNHHNARKAKAPYLKEWRDSILYEAICEGDDYWIDPQKLQKQVDFMESHPDCTMTCSRAKLYSEKQHKYIGETYCYTKNCDVLVKDVIYRQGLFISTPSIVYRIDLKKNYPDYCSKCAVGDYPLQIYAVLKGKVRYFNDAMVVYRTQNSQSWMGQQGWLTASDSRLSVMRSTINMLKGFACEYPQYRELFDNKIADFINRGIPYRKASKEDINKYMSFFSSDFEKFSLLRKIDQKIRLSKIPRFRFYYEKLIMSKFNYHKLFY